MAPDVSAYHEGQKLDVYELLRPLGRGATAEVWLALQTGAMGFRKQVALKLFPAPEDDDAARFHTFENEVRLCGLLQHPRIVDFYQAGQGDETWYVAMEFVGGPTLKKAIRTLGPLGLSVPRSTVLDLGIGIAEALDHAHTATHHDGRPLGLIHRDLKPANVILSRKAGLKVTDFGIAKATTDEEQSVGLFKGTPAYVSPEVWELTENPTPAMDLFSLGLILFEAATGERLLQGRQMTELAGHCLRGSADEDAERVAHRMPELVEPLRALLQRDPARRVQSAKAVLRMLRPLRARFTDRADVALFAGLLEGLGDGECSVAVDDLPETADPDWLDLYGAALGPQAVPRRGISGGIGEATHFSGSEPESSGGGGDPAEDDGGAGGDEVLLETLASQFEAVEFEGEAAAAGPGQGAVETVTAQATVDTMTAQATLDTMTAQATVDRPAVQNAEVSRPAPTRRRFWVVAIVPVLALGLWFGVTWTDRDEGPLPGTPTGALDPAVAVAPRSIAEEPAALEPDSPSPAPPVLEPDPTLAVAAPEGSGSVLNVAEPVPAEQPDVPPKQPDVPAEQPDVPAADPQPAERAAADPPQPAEPVALASAAEPEVSPVEVAEQVEQPACLVLQSRPAGAGVWVDGQKIGARARGGAGATVERPAGRVRVEMGTRSSPLAGAAIELTAGRKTIVSCELLTAPACTAFESVGPCG